eukprot:m.174998 g.174998  ORF g.174998 m.174998 type:complete len:614 (-) comp14886_c0_seq3:121-1962(-)
MTDATSKGASAAVVDEEVSASLVENEEAAGDAKRRRVSTAEPSGVPQGDGLFSSAWCDLEEASFSKLTPAQIEKLMDKVGYPQPEELNIVDLLDICDPMGRRDEQDALRRVLEKFPKFERLRISLSLFECMFPLGEDKARPTCTHIDVYSGDSPSALCNVHPPHYQDAPWVENVSQVCDTYNVTLWLTTRPAQPKPWVQSEHVHRNCKINVVSHAADHHDPAEQRDAATFDCYPCAGAPHVGGPAHEGDDELAYLSKLFLRTTADHRPNSQNFRTTTTEHNRHMFDDSACLRVAILDTGVDVLHDKIGSYSGVKIADVRSFIPGQAAFIDVNGHGTHCYGIFAQVVNHGMSSRLGRDAGIACTDTVHVYIGKVLGNDGRGSVESVIAGIRWARQMKCDVVSMSLGFPRPNVKLEAEVRAATAEGVLLVAAASNGGIGRLRNIDYPAAYSNVICVGSHSERRRPSDFCPEGKELDFLAPGERVLSIEAGSHGMVRLSGTSMATPAAVGVVAQIVAYHRMHRAERFDNSADFEERFAKQDTLLGRSQTLMHGRWTFDFGVFERDLTEREIRVILQHMCSRRTEFSKELGFGILDPREFLLRNSYNDCIYSIIASC